MSHRPAITLLRHEQSQFDEISKTSMYILRNEQGATAVDIHFQLYTLITLKCICL